MLNYENHNKCEILRQHRSQYFLIAEEILTFTWSIRLSSEVKNLHSDLKNKLNNDVLRYR